MSSFESEPVKSDPVPVLATAAATEIEEVKEDTKVPLMNKMCRNLLINVISYLYIVSYMLGRGSGGSVQAACNR